jgi:Na+-transporting NADH:ubiquinone oxidoreductase subunit C
LWGPIHGIVALLADLKTIKGITIIHQEETPGLGGRIAETDFLDKFKAKKVFPRLIIQPPGKAVAENEVDGITGATLSCKAFEAILNSEIEKYVSVIRENR